MTRDVRFGGLFVAHVSELTAGQTNRVFFFVACPPPAAVDSNKHQRVSVYSPYSPHLTVLSDFSSAPCHGGEYNFSCPSSFPSFFLLLFLLSQVFSMFLETLVDFITLHRDDLQDWLFVLLTQLLKKMGADLLGSVQAKVQKALDVTRSAAGLPTCLFIIQ